MKRKLSKERKPPVIPPGKTELNKKENNQGTILGWAVNNIYLDIMKTPTIDLKLQNWNAAERTGDNNEETEN